MGSSSCGAILFLVDDKSPMRWDIIPTIRHVFCRKPTARTVGAVFSRTFAALDMGPWATTTATKKERFYRSKEE